MKILKTMYALCAWMLVLLVAACSEKTDYVTLVPNDAAIVVKMDVLQLAEKTGAMENEQLMQKLTDELNNAADVPASVKEKLGEILNDPAKAGVDLRYPLYFYMKDEQRMGFVGALVSKTDFEALIASLSDGEACTPVKSAADLSYTIMDGNTLLAFDDARFLITPVNYEERENNDLAVDKAKAAFAQTAEGSILTAAGFSKLVERKADMAFCFSYKMLAEMKEFAPVQDIYKQIGLNLEELAIMGSVNFGAGETVLSYEALPLTDKAKEMVKGAGNEKVTGDHLKYVSEKALFAMAVGLNGEKLVAQLEKMDFKKILKGQGLYSDELVNMVLDILKSLDGDMTIALNEFSLALPKVGMFVEVKDKALLDLLAQNVGALPMVKKVSDTQYVVKDHSGEGTFGQDGDTFYFLFGTSELKKADPAISTKLFKGKYGYATFSMDELLANPMVQQAMRNPEMAVAMPVLKEIARVDMDVEEITRVDVKVVMKEADANLLTLICGVVMEMANKSL